jgi:hypothetical protein
MSFCGSFLASPFAMPLSVYEYFLVCFNFIKLMERLYSQVRLYMGMLGHILLHTNQFKSFVQLFV